MEFILLTAPCSVMSDVNSSVNSALMTLSTVQINGICNSWMIENAGPVDDEDHIIKLVCRVQGDSSDTKQTIALDCIWKLAGKSK